MRPKGRGRPQRILLGKWPEEHIRNVIQAVVFREGSGSSPGRRAVGSPGSSIDRKYECLSTDFRSAIKKNTRTDPATSAAKSETNTNSYLAEHLRQLYRQQWVANQFIADAGKMSKLINQGNHNFFDYTAPQSSALTTAAYSSMFDPNLVNMLMRDYDGNLNKFSKSGDNILNDVQSDGNNFLDIERDDLDNDQMQIGLHGEENDSHSNSTKSNDEGSDASADKKNGSDDSPDSSEFENDRNGQKQQQGLDSEGSTSFEDSPTNSLKGWSA